LSDDSGRGKNEDGAVIISQDDQTANSPPSVGSFAVIITVSNEKGGHGFKVQNMKTSSLKHI
jgi:hypothetical protein